MTLKTLLAKVGACAALATVAATAHAELYNFKLTGDYNASWQLDSDALPNGWSDGIGFVLWDIAGNFPGAVSGVTDLTFYHSSIGGGMAIEDFAGDAVLLLADGPQLYTGAESAPSFRLGAFELTEYQGPGRYTLTVSAVPEPASIALMLAGLGVLGAAAGRGRQAVRPEA